MTRLLRVLSVAALLGAGACSQIPKMPQLALPSFGATPTAATTAPRAETSRREHIVMAIDLLDAGKAEEAERHLRAVLASAPKDATGLRLLEQIEKDPKQLLGAQSQAYVVAPGDTMSGLAARYLGDPLLFYALSRYNNLAAPNTLSVGRSLNIPRIASQSTVAAAPGRKSPSPVQQTADADKANATRQRALESLNNGDVATAVSLLQEAQSLNTADTAIGRDLDRALRIQAALKNG